MLPGRRWNDDEESTQEDAVETEAGVPRRRPGPQEARPARQRVSEAAEKVSRSVSPRIRHPLRGVAISSQAGPRIGPTPRRGGRVPPGAPPAPPPHPPPATL